MWCFLGWGFKLTKLHASVWHFLYLMTGFYTLIALKYRIIFWCLCLLFPSNGIENSVSKSKKKSLCDEVSPPPLWVSCIIWMTPSQFCSHCEVLILSKETWSIMSLYLPLRILEYQSEFVLHLLVFSKIVKNRSFWSRANAIKLRSSFKLSLNVFKRE